MVPDPSLGALLDGVDHPQLPRPDDLAIEAGGEERSFLASQVLVVVTVVSLATLPLGLCFPIGLRVVRRISDDATPWMWGVNGATGVLASVSAVAISMWTGISTSLYLAAGAYALLVIPAVALWYRGSPSRDTLGPGSWNARGEADGR